MMGFFALQAVVISRWFYNTPRDLQTHMDTKLFISQRKNGISGGKTPNQMARWNPELVMKNMLKSSAQRNLHRAFSTWVANDVTARTYLAQQNFSKQLHDADGKQSALAAAQHELEEARKAAAKASVGRTLTTKLPGIDAADIWGIRGFWFAVVGLQCANFTFGAVVANLVPILTDFGISPGILSLMVMVCSLCGLSSKIGFSLLANRIGACNACVLSLVIQAAGVTLLGSSGSSAPGAWSGVIVYGFGYGAVGALIPLVTLEIVGGRDISTIVGVIQLCSIVPSFAGPMMFGVLYDTNGNYFLPLMCTAFIFLMGAVAMKFVPGMMLGIEWQLGEDHHATKHL
jgi:hypothetical protein